MKCPRDATTLDRDVREGIEVDICPACAGLWLEPGELQALEEAYVEQGKRIPPPHDEMTHGLQMAEERNSAPTTCPRCGSENAREEYGLASRVLVDRCPNGHGLWLDKGELELIEEFYARHRAEARVPVLVQFIRQIGLTWD